MDSIVLNWGNIIAILGVFVSAVGVGSGVVFALWKQIGKIKSEQDAAIRDTNKELDEFKLMVASNYISTASMMAMKEDLIRSEERTLAAINNLADRFDRFLSKQP